MQTNFELYSSKRFTSDKDSKLTIFMGNQKRATKQRPTNVNQKLAGGDSLVKL